MKYGWTCFFFEQKLSIKMHETKYRAMTFSNRTVVEEKHKV